MAEKWYDKSIKQTEIQLNTDSSTGLKREAVERRLRVDGPNDVYPAPKKSFRDYLKHLLTDYTAILMVITIIIAAVYERVDSIFVMIAILASYYVIIVSTYVKSQQVLEGMGRYALPNVKVLRGGRLHMVKQQQLVRGDVIYVSAGDIVPCDARLVESDALEILEVNVTSVTHAVRKDARFAEYHDISPAQQRNMIFASTIVTRGTGKAICCETGNDTLVSIMKKNTPVISHERLEILENISAFSKRWTLVMTVITMLLTVLDLFLSKSSDSGIFGSFLTGLSLAVSSMSEFYIAFAYIVLACGIFAAVNKKREVNSGALIKNSAKLESIKNLTCLIVPKESAFNIRGMKIDKIHANGDTYAQGEHGYKKNAARVLRYALISTGIYGAGKLIENNQRRENIYSSEEETIIVAAEECGEYSIQLENRYPMLDHKGRGIDCRFETTLVNYENRYFAALRGDYASILPLCKYYTEDSRVLPMTEEKLNELYIVAEEFTRESCRVIAVASKDTIYNNLKRLSACHCDLTFEGFIAVKESILPDVAKNIVRCKNAGIKVIMTCTDNNENNVHLAESLGIITSHEGVVSGEELSKMKEGMFRANLDVFGVYQGLNLAQRRLLVRFLQEKGEKVGYLCTELDEIILMKEADVGFSQSVTLSDKAGGAGIDLSGKSLPVYSKNASVTNRGGCEALKFVSDVIISEPDKQGNGGFNAMLDALICSRSVYYNLHRMLKYMITSQSAKLAIIFISLFLGIVSLEPQQILFCGLVVDFAAMVIIAFEKTGPSILNLPSNVTDKLKNPIRMNFSNIIMGILWAVVALLSTVILEKYELIPAEAVSCYCFVTFIVSQIAVLNECKREQSVFDKNVKINGAYILMLVTVFVFFVLAFRSELFGALFSIVPLSWYALIGIIGVPVIITFFFEVYKSIDRKSK